MMFPSVLSQSIQNLPFARRTVSRLRALDPWVMGGVAVIVFFAWLNVQGVLMFSALNEDKDNLMFMISSSPWRQR